MKTLAKRAVMTLVAAVSLLSAATSYADFDDGDVREAAQKIKQVADFGRAEAQAARFGLSRVDMLVAAAGFARIGNDAQQIVVLSGANNEDAAEGQIAQRVQTIKITVNRLRNLSSANAKLNNLLNQINAQANEILDELD